MQITRLAKEEVFGIARKALADLATASLEERMGEVFTRRLREMDGKAKELLGAALKTSSEPAVVRSAFDHAGRRRGPRSKMRSTKPSRRQSASGSKPRQDAICGIELTANGQKVGVEHRQDYLGARCKRSARS